MTDVRQRTFFYLVKLRAVIKNDSISH